MFFTSLIMKCRFFIESLQVIRPAYTVSAAWWIFVGWKFPIGDGINQ